MRACVLMSMLLAASVSWGQNCPTRASWPTTEWPQALVDPIAKASAIAALESAAFTLTGTDAERHGVRTDSLIIIKHGEIKYERYARGFDETKRHLTWSVAKSISSALTGVAVQLKVLSLDDSICNYLTEFTASSVCRIRVRDPITFGTGLRWQEGYEDESYQTSSVISMFFGVGHLNHLAHILSHDIIAEPGKQWRYSTGDAELAAAVAKRALARKYGNDAFWTQLFDKIGMTSMTIQEDVTGTPIGGALMFATPRDFARMGWLYMNDGCWNGERLLPEGWVHDSSQPSDAYVNHAEDIEDHPSGYSWWLNVPTPEVRDAAGALVRSAKTKPYADSPSDAIIANGHWGQYIIVIPSEDVVIVRTGDDRDTGMGLNKLMTLSLEVVR